MSPFSELPWSGHSSYKKKVGVRDMALSVRCLLCTREKCLSLIVKARLAGMALERQT